MQSEQVLEEGAFARWPASLRRELQDNANNLEVGQRVLFEDDQIRVWSIELEPGQRLPFHRHTHDYTWTCLTPGSGLTHYGTGDAYRVTYQRGDQAFYDQQAKGDFTHDLQNIGDAALRFVTVEYLRCLDTKLKASWCPALG